MFQMENLFVTYKRFLKLYQSPPPPPQNEVSIETMLIVI
jgi:hypothetical protein